jgi:hypothetical protein
MAEFLVGPAGRLVLLPTPYHVKCTTGMNAGDIFALMSRNHTRFFAGVCLCVSERDGGFDFIHVQIEAELKAWFHIRM